MPVIGFDQTEVVPDFEQPLNFMSDTVFDMLINLELIAQSPRCMLVVMNEFTQSMLGFSDV